MQGPGFIKKGLKWVVLGLVANDFFWRTFGRLAVFVAERFVSARGEWVSGQIADKIRDKEMVVLEGPFRGMRYPDLRAAGSAILPKLLGTYERELVPTVEDYLRRELPLVIDVGCAEGYYAVGMALRLPLARIFAYDTSPEAQSLCRQMAQCNKVEDRVIVRSQCSPVELQQFDFSLGGLVICDCEGYEVDLFDAAMADHLKWADLLIELHDCKREGVTEAIVNTFASTHDIQIIHSTDDAQKIRTYHSPLVSRTDAFERLQAFTERRREVMTWAVLTPQTADKASDPMALSGH